jgi:predicted metal-binding membrane protein
MKALRSYPGVLILLLIAAAMLVHGLVDYINYEAASPSILAAIGCLFSAVALVAVYEFRSFKANRRLVRNAKNQTF